MRLTKAQDDMFAGHQGQAAKTALEILHALGEIYGAEDLVPVAAVQIAGVSYHNLGEAGLEYLQSLALDGRVCVPTMLNPAGMDLERYQEMGIAEDFAAKQQLVMQAFRDLGVAQTCTCTPYLAGYRPGLAEHIAWAESSAVTFANSVLGRAQIGKVALRRWLRRYVARRRVTVCILIKIASPICGLS